MTAWYSPVNLSSEVDYSTFDMIFLWEERLRPGNRDWFTWIYCTGADQLWNNWMPDFRLWFICGAYQLLGTHYESAVRSKQLRDWVFLISVPGVRSTYRQHCPGLPDKPADTYRLGFEKPWRENLPGGDKSLEPFGMVLGWFWQQW